MLRGFSSSSSRALWDIRIRRGKVQRARLWARLQCSEVCGQTRDGQYDKRSGVSVWVNGGVCADNDLAAMINQEPPKRRVRFAASPVSATHRFHASQTLDPWEPLDVPAHSRRSVWCKYVQKDYTTCSHDLGYSCNCNVEYNTSRDRLIAASVAADYVFIVDAVPRGNGWWPAYHQLTRKPPRADDNDCDSTGSDDNTGNREQKRSQRRAPALPPPPPLFSCTDYASPSVIMVDLKLPKAKQL